MNRFGPNRGVAVTTMVLLALVIVVPLIWVFRIALKPPEQYISDPASWGGGVTLNNFAEAWTLGHLDSAILNSLTIVPLAALGATVLATLAGFALSKLDFVGKRIVWAAVLVSLMMPVAALALPIFDVALRIGFVDSRPGLTLIFISLFASWGAVFMYSYFRSLPNELLESAKVDGAGLLRAFLTIAVPLALPAIATTFFLNIFIQWGELILSLVILPDTDKQTLTVSVAQFASKFRSTGPLQAAGILIAAAPMLLLFLFAQRWLRAETFSGGVEK